MNPLAVNETLRKIGGTWRLPIKEDDCVTITLFPNGHFSYVISAYSLAKKATQILTGPDWAGNWHIRSTCKKALSSASSLSSFPGIASRRSPTKPLAGPYLVLNFTDISKSIMNLRFGLFQFDFANWFNNFAELFRDGNYRVLELTESSLKLEGPDGVQTWTRITESFV